MQGEEKKESVFPPELSHLEVKLNEAEAKIAEIDQQIDQLPPDRGWRLELTPPGYSNRNQPGTKQAANFQYEQQKNTLRSEIYNDFEAEENKYDKNTVDNIKAKLQERLDEPYKSKQDKGDIDTKKQKSSQHFDQKQEQWGRAILGSKFDTNKADITGITDLSLSTGSSEYQTPNIEPDKD